MKHSSMAALRAFAGTAIVSALLLAPSSAYAAWDFSEQRLTTNEAFQNWPEISGSSVVFNDYRNARDVGDPNDPDTVFDIRVLDLRTMKEKDLTPDESASYRAAISGDNVVWEDYGYGSRKGGIYHYNLRTGVRKRLPISSGRDLRISGSRLVYESSRGVGWNVFMFDLKTGKEKRLTPDGASAGVPDISGDKVVYHDHRNGNFDVYLYDLTTSIESRITTDTNDQMFPRISGNRIVWEDDRAGILDKDVYLYDLRTGTETPLTNHPSLQYRPAISGDIVVWQDERHDLEGDFFNDQEIYLFDLASGTEQRVTHNTGYQGNVTVSGNRIVWEDHLRPSPADNMDLYMVTIPRSSVSAKAPTSVSYGTRPSISGTLRSAGGSALAARAVAVEYSKDRSRWTRGETTLTAGDGSYRLLGPSLVTKRYVRVRFAGDSDNAGGVSSSRLIKARLSFTDAPRFRSYAHRLGSTYRVWGYFKPEHPSGSHQIKVRAYRRERQSDGTYRYVYRRTYSTTTSNPSGSAYTKYLGCVRLPNAGTWRLRAYHAEDTNNASSFSAYRRVSVTSP